jgi:DNA-binding MarR family transcriptional regulator
MAALEHPTPGYLVWRLAMKFQTAVDRAVSPLGLTHAQYSLLASLRDITYRGARPSQRELADLTGLDPIFVSKLIRTLEGNGLVERTRHPSDGRAVQLSLTDHGIELIDRAVIVVRALQDELLAPLGGTRSRATKQLVATLESLLAHPPEGDPR